MTIDLNRLRGFATIVDANGFQAAAARLNVAQPWLSVQLRQLEEALGYQLLVRSRAKGVELTAEGENFLPLARQVLRSFDEMLSGARQIGSLRTQVLKLGADPYTLHVPIRNVLIAEFMQHYPDTKLEIVSATPAELLVQLLSHDHDMIICGGPTPDGCVAMPLCTYATGLLLPRESPLATQEQIDLESLRGGNVLAVSASYYPEVVAELAAYFSQYDIGLSQAPEPGYAALIRYAQTHRSPVATVDFPSAFHEIPGDMVFRPIAPPRFAFTFSLFRLDTAMSKSASRFWSLAQSLVA